MNKKILTLVFALLVILVLAYTRTQKDDRQERITYGSREPITLIYYASYERLSLDRLIAESDLVVIGNLKAVYASRWNTPDGKRPADNWAQEIKPGFHIFTDMDFHVNQLLKGDAQQRNIRIRSLGGIVEGDRMIADEIVPKMNKTYLIFLSLGKADPTNNMTAEHYWIMGGGFQGMYEIIDEKAISKVDEWNLDDLIAYIQTKLSEAPMPAEVLIGERTEAHPTGSLLEETVTPTPTEPPVETAAPTP